MLRQGALRHPEREAFFDGQQRLSYGALDAAASAFAERLVAAGIEPGDAVGLLAGNGAPCLVAFFGTVYAGGVVVPLPAASAPAEVRFRLERSGARLLLFDEARRSLAEASGAESSGAGCLGAGSSGTESLGAGSSSAVGWPLDGKVVDASSPPFALRNTELAMVLFTSGTTGEAKGAAITHASLWSHTAALCFHTLRLSAADVVLAVLPFAHSFGLRMTILAPFFAGARVVSSERFDAAESLALAAAEGVSWMCGVPTMFRRWAEVPGSSWAKLRWALSAGAPLPRALSERASKRLGAPVREGYGLTEATFCCVGAPDEDVPEGSVGRSVWGVDVAVVDGERRCGIGERGELRVAGQNVMRGYLGDDPVQGYFATGDLGYVDADGFVFVVDRLKDMILRGGHNVYPAEVEAALAEHPAVAAAAVVGRPCDAFGEEVVAVVVLRDGASLAGLDGFLRERVARTKLPREVAVVESLPLGPSRKVLKRELRRRLVGGALSVVELASLG